MYNWIERKSLPNLHDLNTTQGWHTIIDSYSNHLVLFVDTTGPEAEKSKKWLKRFEKIANYVNDHELLSLCDLSKPKCKEFIKLLGVHNRKFEPMSVAYIVPHRDGHKHLGLFEPLSIPHLEIDAIINYIDKCKEGEGHDQTAFMSEKEEAEKGEIVYENVKKLAYKSLANKLNDHQNDILVFMRHRSHEKLTVLDKSFDEVALKVKKNSDTEFYHYDLDKNSVHGLGVKESPIIRLYKSGYVRQNKDDHKDRVNHKFKDLFINENDGTMRFKARILAFLIDNSTEYLEFDEENIADM